MVKITVIRFGKVYAARSLKGFIARGSANGAYTEPLIRNPNSCQYAITHLQGWVIMSQLGSLCVGIDVSKAILDIAASSAIEQFSVGNDSDGFEAIIAELRMYAIALVLMKATGGLETAIVCALQAEGFELAVVNPRQARDFARAMGYLAKTDSIDARVLSQMAEVLNRHPERERFIRALPDTECQVLTAMVVRRRQLITMLVAERNRLHPAHP
ncbi:transposase [Escherichia coli MS 116-1]|nr:transposase [Escherichia coli MS 116-1]